MNPTECIAIGLLTGTSLGFALGCFVAGLLKNDRKGLTWEQFNEIQKHRRY